MDHVPREVRSKIMASVRSKGNRTTEVALAKVLRAADLRGYRKHWPIVGKPDFAWPGLKVAVFVDGCFWHGCARCKYLPRTRRRFWKNKIETNVRRDRRVSQRLRRAGWRVLRVRECAVELSATIRRIAKALAANRSAAAH